MNFASFWRFGTLIRYKSLATISYFVLVLQWFFLLCLCYSEFRVAIVTKVKRYKDKDGVIVAYQNI